MVHRLVIAICFLFLTGSSVCTYACSCPRFPVLYHFENSTYVFLAEIAQIEKRDPISGVVGGGIVKATFSVRETFKGRPTDLISISSNTEAGMCGEAGMLVPGVTLLSSLVTEASAHVEGPDLTIRPGIRQTLWNCGGCERKR